MSNFNELVVQLFGQDEQQRIEAIAKILDHDSMGKDLVIKIINNKSESNNIRNASLTAIYNFNSALGKELINKILDDETESKNLKEYAGELFLNNVKSEDKLTDIFPKIVEQNLCQDLIISIINNENKPLNLRIEIVNQVISKLTTISNEYKKQIYQEYELLNQKKVRIFNEQTTLTLRQKELENELNLIKKQLRQLEEDQEKLIKDFQEYEQKTETLKNTNNDLVLKLNLFSENRKNILKKPDEKIFLSLINIIKEQLDETNLEVTLDSHFEYDLGIREKYKNLESKNRHKNLDQNRFSLYTPMGFDFEADWTEFIMVVEEEFEIEIPNKIADNIETVGQLYKYILDNLGEIETVGQLYKYLLDNLGEYELKSNVGAIEKLESLLKSLLDNPGEYELKSLEE